MAIRPKEGARVRLKSWQVIDGQKAPATPWLATVEKVNSGSGWRTYDVKRDHDGEVITVWSCDMSYANEIKL
ncbi:hypothetical protein [Paenibacillus sp. BK720]|uniref:hypothetical protein n=1 Tax=Paenibacillus sp. BK720 TaxID=2587092 RepID=UPI001420B7D2|nr:hypothetical protein [Paenibacillus sp. BK720]NIK67917.1 hypothetical protein [Paenibacillus sp. BK720]